MNRHKINNNAYVCGNDVTQHNSIAGFGVYMGFVDKKENIEYEQTYPLTQTTSNCDATFMKQSPFELCERHNKHVCCDSY